MEGKMQNLIEKKLIEHYMYCDVDKYAQVGILSLFGIFRDEMDEVLEYAKNDDSLIQISTYGGSLGTFKGIQIVDKELRMRCHDALELNDNYKQAMTNW
jgi:hypothetical protein